MIKRSFNSFQVKTTLWVGLICLPTVAQACPENLKGLKTRYLGDQTICQVYDRFDQVKASYQKNGLSSPERISEVLAPRFINGPTWASRKQAMKYDPWFFYSPAPLSWKSWELGNDYVDGTVKFSKINFDLKWLRRLHKATLTGLYGEPGNFRTTGESGLSLSRKYSVTRSQATQMRAGGGYMSQMRPDEPLYTWRATLCLEDQKPETVQYMKDRAAAGNPSVDLKYWPEIDANTFYVDESGVEKQCGYVTYPDAEELDAELAAWMFEINKHTKSWETGTRGVDPLLVVSRAQRWLIGIHPFVDGNGRVSRFVMDRMVKTLGLPAPILKEMNDDMYMSEREWAKEIGQGILRSLSIMENCAANTKTEGCNLVSTTPGEQP